MNALQRDQHLLHKSLKHVIPPKKPHLKANSDHLRLADDLSENKHARKIAPNYYSNLKPSQPANARDEAQSHDEIAFSS